MILKLSLELPEQSASVGVARGLSRRALEYLGVEPAVIDDLEFIVGELASNVVRHAHGRRYRVELECYADRVAIIVTDAGAGFSFYEVPSPGSERLDECGRVRIGGFGLMLVQAMADRLTLLRADPEGSTVRAEKGLRPPLASRR